MATQRLTLLITSRPCYQTMGTQRSTSEAEGSRDLFVFVSLRNIITFDATPVEDPPKACVQPKGTVRPGMEDRLEECSSRSIALVRLEE